ncbi:MAG: hypothetical protein HY909_11905 [Deltaproteobacteria bacterium]|nr:hypothetical protein [Deltaproteobacteria bacterium]
MTRRPVTLLGLSWQVLKLRPGAALLGVGLLAAPGAWWALRPGPPREHLAREEAPDGWAAALRARAWVRGPHGVVVAPAIAWSEGRHGLAWLSWDGAQERVCFRALTAEGVPLGRLTTIAGDIPWPVLVAPLRGGFGLAWNQAEWEPFELKTLAAALTPDGALRHPPIVLTPPGAMTLAMDAVQDGDGLAVAGYLREDRIDAFIGRMTFTGQPLGRAVRAMTLRGPSFDQLTVHRVEGGLEVSVGELDWRSASTTLRTVRVPDQGGPEAPRTLWVSDGVAERITARRVGGESVGVFLEDASVLPRGTPSAFGFRGAPGASPRSLAPRSATGGPSLAPRGDEAAVVWTRTLGGDTAVLLQRVDAQARPVGAVVRLDGAGPDVEAGRLPRATATDTGYSVVWEGSQREAPGLWLRRTDPQGAPLGAPLRVVEP